MNFEIIKGKYHTIEELVRDIHMLLQTKSTVVIGVDGCGGSGKSTFAGKIKDHFSDVTIVHKDDFYLPSDQLIKKHPTQKPVGADFDWRRLLKQVLEPLSMEKESQYQRYDWEKDCLAEWHTVPAAGVVIIEGVYSIRIDLEDYYDLKIWVNCPRETRLSRGLDRDGEAARDTWENNWMISEDLYVETQKPNERADVVIDGTK